MNITITSLSLLSMMSTSPLYSTSFLNQRSRSLLTNLYFSNFIFHTIYLNNQNQHTIISNSKFHSTLHSAIFMAKNPDCRSVLWEKDLHFTGKPIKNLNIAYKDYEYLGSGVSDYRTYILCNNSETLGDVIVAGCTFTDCRAGFANGGAMSIEQNSTVMVHDSLFINCSTVKKGGALYICRTPAENENKDEVDLTNYPIPKLDVQYCCFQECYINNRNNGYGAAMFSSATISTLFYTSTTNCANNDDSKGAQFDLQATDVSSKYINITGGKATATCGIEYRTATSGFFKFQTMAKMECTWVTAFTKATISNLNLSYCNYIDNTIYKRDYNDVQVGLIFIKETDIIIDHFYFKGTNSNDFKIVARDGSSGSKNVKLIDCYIDNYNDNMISAYTIENLHTGDIKLYDITFLNKGDCKGEKTPEPLIITSIFTPSGYFSKTEYFTETSDFSKSFVFSNSLKFSQSDKFSETGKFTKSSFFSETSKFTKTSFFSETGKFTKSSMFSETGKFTKSSFFSETDEFTKSSLFSGTDDFSKSSLFSSSGLFTPSKIFTDSDDFLRTKKFTKSSTFTSSNSFSNSFQFTESGHFTKSLQFSGSKKFSFSHFFSQSIKFTRSNNFNKTAEFLVFSPSNHLINIIIRNDSQKESKINVGPIAGIAAGAAALIALAILAVILMNKRKKLDDSEIIEAETIESEVKSVYDNPLFNQNMKDDPFLEDFDEI